MTYGALATGIHEPLLHTHTKLHHSRFLEEAEGFLWPWLGLPSFCFSCPLDPPPNTCFSKSGCCDFLC